MASFCPNIWKTQCTPVGEHASELHFHTSVSVCVCPPLHLPLLLRAKEHTHTQDPRRNSPIILFVCFIRHGLMTSGLAWVSQLMMTLIFWFSQTLPPEWCYSRCASPHLVYRGPRMEPWMLGKHPTNWAQALVTSFLSPRIISVSSSLFSMTIKPLEGCVAVSLLKTPLNVSFLEKLTKGWVWHHSEAWETETGCGPPQPITEGSALFN